MKKIMIIGAGPGQVPIINLAKEKGFETHVVSPKGPYPGILLADKHINEDIYNIDKLIEIGKRENVSYVISDQSDYAVPIVAKIAEALGLPGNQPEVAATYTFKNKFRSFCCANEIPSPKAISIHPSDDLRKSITNFTYPLVVKPADSQGSRGINKVHSFDQLELAIQDAYKYSRDGNIIIEEFFKGKELVVEGFVLNGEYYSISIGEREYFEINDRFIPSKTLFPSMVSNDIKEAIIKNEQLIASKLKPSFGIVHSEYLVKDANEFVVIESALRGGGVYIASHLIPLTTGVNLTQLLFDAMLGNFEKVKDNLSIKAKGFAEYVCFYLEEGIVTQIEGGNKICELPGIIKSEIDNIHVGDKVNKFEHKGMRKGPFLIYSESQRGLVEICDKLKQTFKIYINGKPGIVWD